MIPHSIKRNLNHAVRRRTDAHAKSLEVVIDYALEQYLNPVTQTQSFKVLDFDPLYLENELYMMLHPDEPTPMEDRLPKLASFLRMNTMRRLALIMRDNDENPRRVEQAGRLYERLQMTTELFENAQDYIMFLFKSQPAI